MPGDSPDRRVVFGFLFALALVASGLGSGISAAEREPLTLVTASGEHRVQVEIADTPESRARGLMFRRSLGESEGMLFLYDEAQRISMWMRNTYIPLDMIFIDAAGIVQRIERRTEPFSERVIDSGAPVAAVLEVGAGTADRIGLRPGDKVRHRVFAE